MKKPLVILLVTLQILCFFTACTESSGSSPRVLEIQTKNYSENVEGINHTYEVKYPTSATIIDPQMPETKTITLGDKVFSLKYKESKTAGTSNSRHYYTIQGTEVADYAEIVFYNNGEIRSISNLTNGVCFIEGITPHIPAEEASRLVQEKLSPWIDFSQYETLNARGFTYSSTVPIEEGNDDYDLHWIHTINGVHACQLYMRLKNNGDLLWIILPPSEPEISDSEYEEGFKKCPLETHEALLNTKLAQIYNTDTTEYKDWYIQSSSLQPYEGKPAMFYQLVVSYRKKNIEKDWRDLCELLIVLE